MQIQAPPISFQKQKKGDEIKKFLRKKPQKCWEYILLTIPKP
jgi:hypothetical protein